MDPRLEMLFSRRSVRKYSSEPVSEADIQALLEAGMAAPSASNIKPWHLVLVTDRSALAALAEAHPYGKMTADAAIAIAVCANKDASPSFWVQDCAAVTENILIAAAGLGLGAVWLGCHPRDDREDAVRNTLQIPNEIGVLSLIPIGHPVTPPPARTQFDSGRVHRDRW